MYVEFVVIKGPTHHSFLLVASGYFKARPCYEKVVIKLRIDMSGLVSL